MENEKVLSSEEVLAPSRDAVHDALKRLTSIEGVNVHAGIVVTVDVTSYTHGFDTKEAREMREKIYETQAELIIAHPGVLFDFKVR